MSKNIEGKPSPAFDLPATGEKNLSKEDLKGQKYLLFFYPKDNTAG
jgi:thioredoxin-dependent peroxiredoxin